jgi:hypothetical protein
MLVCFRKWFGDDGELISQPDPCRIVPFRPAVFDEVNPILKVEYKPVNISACVFINTSMYVHVYICYNMMLVEKNQVWECGGNVTDVLRLLCYGLWILNPCFQVR